jgi:hypothetical protein
MPPNSLQPASQPSPSTPVVDLDAPNIHSFLHDILAQYIPEFYRTQGRPYHPLYALQAHLVVAHATSDILHMFTFFKILRRDPKVSELRVRHFPLPPQSDRTHTAIGCSPYMADCSYAWISGQAWSGHPPAWSFLQSGPTHRHSRCQISTTAMAIDWRPSRLQDFAC